MANRYTGFEWTKKQLEILRKRYATDGPTKLSEELGVPYWVLLSKAKRMGIGATRKRPPKGFRWTEEMVTLIREQYVEEGAAELAERFGVNVDTVRRKAASMGLSTIAGHYKAGQKRAESNTTFNIHYFDEWSPNMAYILGFLFADGSIDKHCHSVAVGVVTKDESILQFIKKELSWKLKIKRREGRATPSGGTEQPQSHMVMSSVVMVRQLMRLGLYPRKTYEDDPFPKVPDAMIPHFVRGYFDGDGTVCVTTRSPVNMVCCVAFIGSPKFINGLHSILNSLAGMSQKVIQYRGLNTTPHCSVAWTALNDLRKFYAFAYPEGFGFCLERKRRKLADWLAGKDIQP